MQRIFNTMRNTDSTHPQAEATESTAKGKKSSGIYEYIDEATRKRITEYLKSIEVEL